MIKPGQMHPPDYFYCPPRQIREGRFTIDGEEGAHLVHVMRKKAGDTIRIVDGAGTAYDAGITGIRGKTVTGDVIARYEDLHEPALHVTLGVGMLKNPSKFDFLVEKTVELGVRAIVPLLTERTIPSHAKTDRWQKLALAAMKQCGRSYLPRIHDVTPLSALLAESPPGVPKYIAHEQPLDGAGAGGSVPSAGQLLLLVGPEGGFSEGEVSDARDAGCRPLFFGERRLRTETAAIVAVTAFLTPLGR
ncbi:MAG TPA: RsmE family RNA methyltransferase [Bacteroidota bacterium]|nr:RsmE family RNA methyltransferase [Bacteroidota bacterium]